MGLANWAEEELSKAISEKPQVVRCVIEHAKDAEYEAYKTAFNRLSNLSDYSIHVRLIKFHQYLNKKLEEGFKFNSPDEIVEGIIHDLERYFPELKKQKE